MTTREKILKAALEVFTVKGKEGARMQEIADLAEVNKAMLFYYYTNKDLLYKEMLRKNLIDLISQLKTIMISDVESQDKVEKIVNTYLDFFKTKPHIPKLLLREASSDGESIKEILREIKANFAPDIPNKFLSVFQEGIEEKEFYPIDPKQTIISIIGMSLIYFIGKPIIEVLLEIEKTDERKFIEERKKNILEILKHGLLQRSKDDR